MLDAILLLLSTLSNMRIRVEHVAQEQDEEIRRVALAFGEEIINVVGLSEGQVILGRKFILKA